MGLGEGEGELRWVRTWGERLGSEAGNTGVRVPDGTHSRGGSEMHSKGGAVGMVIDSPRGACRQPTSRKGEKIPYCRRIFSWEPRAGQLLSAHPP